MTDNNTLVLDFSAIRAADLGLVGGKGANLGEMTAAGFPVPSGFCLTTTAFLQFIAANPDTENIYALLDSASDVESVREIGQQVRAALLKTPIPAEVASAALKAWRAIGTEQAYAVRSSATAEDLPGASFAGQQDTYLNIIGEEALLDAIRRCWVSLFTDRAILYRAQNNFPHREVALSVVVQQMVMSEKSGILFTADPLTGHRHTLTIDASFGLGEALVGGLVTPDTYRVDKRTRQISARQVAEKQIAIYPLPEGGTRQEDIPSEERQQPALSDAQILALADLGARIEAHYGKPQDIEWAIAPATRSSLRATAGSEAISTVVQEIASGVGLDTPRENLRATRPAHPRNDIFILQSRPITSLYPIDGLKSPDDSLHVFFSMGHQQNMTRAMSPLSLSNFQQWLPFRQAAEENSLLRFSGGRLFIDITLALRHPILRRLISALLSQFDALAPQAFRMATQRPEFYGPHKVHFSVGFFKGLLKIMRRVFSALWLHDLTGFVAHINTLMDDFITETDRNLCVHPQGKPQIQAVLDAMPSVFPLFLNWVPEAVAGVAATRILPRLAGRYLSADELDALTLGIPGNVVNEMNLMLGDLAEVAQQTPALVDAFDQLGNEAHTWITEASQIPGSEAFFEALDEFLIKYGSRGPSEIDIAMPRWIEDPLPVLHVIAGNIHNETKARAHFEEQVQAREVVFSKLMERAHGARARLIRRLYTAMTQIGGMREHHKFLAVRFLWVVKRILKENAALLVAAGKLAAPDDIWFLTWEELRDIWDNDEIDWRPIIAQRRTDLERYQKLTPPMILTSDGETPVVQYALKDMPPGALPGNPVSAGVVEGVAHVVHDPQKEILQPGEILIAPFTDPGWTPLFINAAGLVMEIGGALAHGSVVAREYGIPAVVGVRGATKKIRTGQRVRVDGDRGMVEVLDSV